MSRVLISHALTAAVAALGGFVLARFSGTAPIDSPLTLSPKVAVAENASQVKARQSDGPPASAKAGGVAAAVRAVQRTSDRATRLYEFALRLRELAPAEFPALFQALRATRSPESPEIFAMLCSAWAAHNGPEAFAAGRTVAAGDGYYRALHAAIVAWARREPEAARAGLASAGMQDLQTDEMAAFVQGWASADPQATEAFLASHTPRGADDELPAAVQRGFEAIAQARIEADPAAAMEWYARLGAPLQERLRQVMLAQLTAKEPRRAAEWLARDEAAQLGASDLVPLLRGLQLDGVEQQFAWARQTANPVSRESALTAVVWENAQAQLVPLGEWLASRSDDPTLAPAFSAYALQVVRKSPNAAITWALSLDGTDLRRQTLNTVAAEWITINPRAAREWAQRTNLVDYESLVR